MLRILTCLSPLTVLAALAACTDPRPLAPAGHAPDAAPPPTPTLYALHSDLDLAETLPGPVGEAVQELIAATDDPDDPARYLVDRVVAQMPDGALKQIALAAEPFVAAYVNQRLLAEAPQLLPRLVAIGHDFGVAARHLGTIDSLEVAADGRATHAIAGVRVVFPDRTAELGFADHGLPTASAPVVLRPRRDRMTLERHELALSLGRVLRLVIDGAIVPHAAPGATDLAGVLLGGVDCASVGSAMAEALGFGDGGDYAAACRAGLQQLATSFYRKLDAANDVTLSLELSGDALAIDRDHDGTIDELTDGVWTGTVTFASSPAPLAGGTFSGARVP